MKFWQGIFAIWAVPSALWMSYAALQGRILYDDMGLREVILLAPPVIFGVLVLGIAWMLNRWPTNGKQT